MSIATVLAKAVAAELNKHVFSLPFEARMSVLPSFEPAELETVRVSVVPVSLETERTTRSSVKYTVGVDIGVQRRIQGTKEETVEAMCSLVDEISDHLMETPLSECRAAQLVGTINEPLYAAEHLTQKRAFTGVLNVKYLLFT